ncbi:MAG: DUF5110 domain-containing protein [Bacteroidaceae bacterium]|nr:DUF5110 domain-containing protein [Bacteroidaceae bacterium]
MRFRGIIAFSLLLAMASCHEGEYRVLPDGVVVNVREQVEGGPQKVRLQLMSDRIVRVTATPDKSFHDRKSLIILPKSGEDVNFDVKDNSATVELQTAGMHVSVNKSDGRVVFADAGGNVISSETDPAQFAPIQAGGTDGYSTVNRFNTTQDEGLYGLGQHQSDQWNYKGQNEELYQYNTKISIPFVISSNGYGILWDSYSMGRFGNTGPYSQLNHVFNLYDRDGNAGSLTGTYESVQNGRWTSGRGYSLFTPGNVSRSEDSLYFVNSEMIKLLPERLGSNVTYEGYLEPKESGEHNFLLYYAGYVKVFIDGDTVVSERWRTAWNPNSWKFSYDMETGRRYRLRIEWKPDGGTSYLGLTAYAPARQDERERLTMWQEMVRESDYYFIAGDNMDGVLRGLHSLVGRPEVLPKWAFGFWQSRQRYTTQDEVVSTFEEFRRRGIGIDNIVQDWNYWKDDSWGSHEFDPDRYPDPKGMVDRIHELDGHIMISVWPKFYHTTDHYREFDSKGWMYTRAVRDSIRDWVGPGYIGSFYDAYSEGARELFWNQLKDHLFPLGFDAWWMDASEPNIRDCVPMDYWKELCGPTALGSSTEYLMAYALMNAEAIYSGLRREDPDRRVFQLTRSGYAGLQRYSTASWSGDIGTRWEDMRSQITAGLNYSLCGNPYWTMDIGGFCTESRYSSAQRLYDRVHVETPDLSEWRELQARWYQFGTFCPLYRAHGEFPLREVWNIAPENHPAYRSIVYYNRLRYRLMPYIYSQAGRAWLNGTPIMRGLVMDFTHDSIAREVSDQYMFGPSMMICPVVEYQARSRSVYLPEGRLWYDFYQDTVTYEGGCTIMADAPYERIPVFVPSGSIIVSGPDMQYVDQVAAKDITVDLYTGRAAYFQLYEDDGETYAYENGAYSVIPFIYTENRGRQTLMVGTRNGEYDGMETLRHIRLRVHRPDGISETAFDYNGERMEININDINENL